MSPRAQLVRQSHGFEFAVIKKLCRTASKSNRSCVIELEWNRVECQSIYGRIALACYYRVTDIDRNGLPQFHYRYTFTNAPDSEFLFIEMGTLKFYD